MRILCFCYKFTIVDAFREDVHIQFQEIAAVLTGTTATDGSCSYQNREEILKGGDKGGDREVLGEDDAGLPYKQEDSRRSCNHPFQATKKQDCRFFYSPHEAYPKGAGKGYFIEAPGGRKGASYGLCVG